MKMETREELLNGLNDAVNLLRQFVNDQQQLNKIRSQYRKTIPNLSWKKMRIAYIVFVVVYLYIYASTISSFLPSYSFIQLLFWLFILE